jgi:hypothetical protein
MASTTDFFSVSAQIIPVLFIAIAFEHRAFGRLEDEPEKDVELAAARFFAFILIVWGEVAALGAVSAHRGNSAEHGTVTMALIAEAVILSIEPTRAFMRAGAGAVPSRFESASNLLLRVVVAVPGVALVLLCVLELLRIL